MSFPICDYELVVALVGHSEAFDTFKPRETFTFGDFNLSTPAGRIRAFGFLRKNMPSDCFIHMFGFLLYSLNLVVHPTNGRMVFRSSLKVLEEFLLMYRYVNHPAINFLDQGVLIRKLIDNRATFANACCRKCGKVELRISRRHYECWHFATQKTCGHLGRPLHEHFGRAKAQGNYRGQLMRFVCYGCTRWGYFLDDNNFLSELGRKFSSIDISETM
jgi:hypothetical protein